jgi:hypothetical protein
VLFQYFQDQSQINMEVLMRPESIPDALVEDECIEARCLEALLRPVPIPEDSLSEKYPIVSQLLRKYPIPDYASFSGHVAASQQQRHIAQQQQQRAADAAEEQQRRVASSRAAAARSLRKCQESSSSSSSSGMLPTTGKATPKHKAAGVPPTLDTDTCVEMDDSQTVDLWRNLRSRLVVDKIASLSLRLERF